MQLSKVGKIVENEWLKTPTIRTNVVLGAWIIMPDHFHGIVIIRNGDNDVGTQCIASLQYHTQPFQQQSQAKYKNKFGPQSNNLSSIIRGFKAACTKGIHIAGYPDFAWQSRYYDRIIRNFGEYNRITKYILNNTRNQKNNKFANQNR